MKPKYLLFNEINFTYNEAEMSTLSPRRLGFQHLVLWLEYLGSPMFKKEPADTNMRLSLKIS